MVPATKPGPPPTSPSARNGTPRPPPTTTNSPAKNAIASQGWMILGTGTDRKSTRLNSSHLVISYAVFCLKKNNLQHSRGARVGVDLPGRRVVPGRPAVLQKALRAGDSGHRFHFFGPHRHRIPETSRRSTF